MKKLFSCVFFFFTLVHFAFADLTIHIVQGVNKPYPIAIVPFGHDVTTSVTPTGLTGVITNDLANSGRFSALPVSQMPADPTQVLEFNWQQWNSANTGVEYAVVGNVIPGTKTGTYKVTFALLSLLSNKPMIGQEYDNVTPSQLRLLAHQISDVVYQTITGVPGYFRTRLAYVQVFNRGTSHTVWELTVSDYDGFNPHVLLKQKGNPIASPTWSPDGKQIAYVSYVNNRQAIFTITLSTGVRRIIANFPGMNSAPAWSPDGKYIAMALSGTDSSDQSDLYVMNLKTRELKRYTTYGNNTSPSWSPDGKTIAFNSNRGGTPQIYALNLTSKQIYRLSYSGVANYAPVYTPNGQNLVIMSQQISGGPIRLATLNIASNTINIITTGVLDKSPSVAPNGDMVVYANYDASKGILAETSLDGTVQINLPAIAGTVQSPAWSPFLN